MNIPSLTWIFFFLQGNYTCHVADIYTGNQLWWQNISNLKETLIMYVFQITETRLNEIILKREHVDPHFRTFGLEVCSTLVLNIQKIFCPFYPKNRYAIF